VLNLTVDCIFLLSILQDGFKPIQVAALRDNLEVVEHLLPLTSPIPGVSNWTVDGIVEYTLSKMAEEKVPLQFICDCFTSSYVHATSYIANSEYILQAQVNEAASSQRRQPVEVRHTHT
jgi:hypothetical protein